MQFIIYQFWVLLASLICGILLGLLFDFYRNFSSRWQKKPLLLGIWDLLFWLIAFAVLFAFWYFFTPGGTRPLLIFFLLVGFVIYRAYLKVDFGQGSKKNRRDQKVKIAAEPDCEQKQDKKRTRKVLVVVHWPMKAFSDAFYNLAQASWDLGLKASEYGKKWAEKLQKPPEEEEEENDDDQSNDEKIKK
ncbi:MAG: spore cortex biosynthesis protein YabQ [Bacillota bacterium]